MPSKSTENELGFVESGMGAALETTLVYNLLRTHSFLEPFIDAEMRRHQVTAAQFNVLLLLREAGETGLLMGEIGQRLIVTKSNVTGLVDRMERQSWVRRTERADRRTTCVCVTKAGLGLLEELIPRHARLLSELTDGLTAAEKQSLIGLLTKLRKRLRHRLEQPS